MRQVVIMNSFNNISKQLYLRCIIILNYSLFCDVIAIFGVVYKLSKFGTLKSILETNYSLVLQNSSVGYNTTCILVYYHTLLNNVQYKHILQCNDDATLKPHLNARCVAYFDLKIIQKHITAIPTSTILYQYYNDAVSYFSAIVKFAHGIPKNVIALFFINYNIFYWPINN